MPLRQPAIQSPYSAAHAQRLRQITGRHSLSEIARRTGLPVSCIHSYLNGTRIPAELFSGLVEHFGVNPAWLHTGDGAVYSSDVAPETATMAQDVLKLVESMEAVGKMRLGAMQGNQPKVRALDEALKRHVDLQQRLSNRTAEIMRKLIDDADVAVVDRNYDVAEAALATAGRLRKLCTDAALAVRLMNTSALLARLRGQLVKAIAGFREAFLNALPARDAMGDGAHSVAFNLSNALVLTGELHEAVAVADGMLVLGEKAHSDNRHILNAHRGWLDVVSGELHKGLSHMARTLPTVPHPRSTRVEIPRYMAAQMYAGLISFDAALAGTDESPNKGAFLTLFALCSENMDQLCRLYDQYFGAPTNYIEDAKGRVGATTAIGKYMTALIGTMRDGDKAALGRFDTHVSDLASQGLPPLHYFMALINATQLARLAGNKPLARKRHKQAQKQLEDMPTAVTPEILDLARHYRNTIKLAGKGSQPAIAQAEAWFSTMVSKGYLCLRQAA